MALVLKIVNSLLHGKKLIDDEYTLKGLLKANL